MARRGHKKFVTTRRIWQWDKEKGIYVSELQQGYWYDGKWTLAMFTQAADWDTEHFQWLDDDNTAPWNCTPSASEDAALVSPTLDTPYALAWALTNDDGAGDDFEPEIQFDIDGGGYNQLTTTSTGVIATAAVNITRTQDERYDDDAGGGDFVTTLASGAWGTAGAHYTEDGTGFNRSCNNNESLEWTWCLEFVDADLSGGETITFRMVNNLFSDDLPTNNNFGLPTATIAAAGGRTTKNTRSQALGMFIGMNWRSGCP